MTSRSFPPLDGPAAPIDCVTAVRRLWDYLDRRLTAPRAEEVEAHLAVCEQCPPHFLFARELQSALAGSTPPSDSVNDDRLRARIALALRR